MEQRWTYLMDSNVAIDYLANVIPEQGAALIDNLPPLIPVITRMELLGWYRASTEQLIPVEQFIRLATILPLQENIILKTIQLRQQHQIKLPDAIIAATALEHELKLLTRNESDFNRISNLEVINPHNL